MDQQRKGLVLVLMMCFFALIVTPCWAVETTQIETKTDVKVIDKSQDINYGSEGKRGFVNPGSVPIPGLISDITGPTSLGYQFTKIYTILSTLGNGESATFTRDDLEDLVENMYPKPKIKPLYFGKNFRPAESSITVYSRILVYSEKGLIIPNKPISYQRGGYLHVNAEKEDNVTLEGLILLMWDSMEHGMNTMYVTGEGVSKEIASSGLSIGTAYTEGHISEGPGGGTSSTAVGGTGYASGKSHCIMLPWNQAAVGYRAP